VFSDPSSPFVAGLESLAVGGLFLLFGYLLANSLFSWARLDRVTLWALAFPSLMAFTLVVMLIHLATGGAVLSRGWVTRGITLAVAAVTFVLWLRRRSRDRPRVSRAEALTLAGMVVLALAVWGSVVFQDLPLPHKADTTLHMGWASQLLNGESTPSGPITGSIPNYYPWLFHALVAVVARFTPGGRAYHTLGPLQLMEVTASIMALYALGKHLVRRWSGAAAAALLGALTGGFGYFLARHADVITIPRGLSATKYGGDLFFVRSYNVAFGNLAPPFPRDVTYVLFSAFLLLLLLGLRGGDLRYVLAGGVTLGLMGLTGAEALFVGMGVALLACLYRGSLSRLRVASATFGPAIALWLLWLAPLFYGYFRLGGFRSMAARPVHLTLAQVLMTWGIATPLAVWGATRALPRVRRDPAVWLSLSVVVAAAAPIVGLVVPRILGKAFVTLERAHRYWPFVSLGVVLLGAFGLSDLFDRASRASVRRVTALAAASVALAIPSPILATVAETDALPPNPEVTRALEGDPNTVLNALSPVPGDPHVVAVPKHLERGSFAYTGYREVAFQWTRPDFGHIRWIHIFDHIASPELRIEANYRLTTGVDIGFLPWLALARRFGVDEVAVPARRIQASAFQNCPKRSGLVDDFIVVYVPGCRSP
jgi:hypothetical protein